jgi:hypothetical protein
MATVGWAPKVEYSGIRLENIAIYAKIDKFAAGR